MAVIDRKLWNGEPIKAVIKIDDNTEYTVYSDSLYGNTQNYIRSINFNLGEGNSNVNPLGISSSNSISLEIYDANDDLSPANKNSKYFGKIVNGIEIDLFISYDGVEFEPYGIYYTTYWSGKYSDGWHGCVSISADDKLNTIGNYELPELPVYSNVEAGDLIANVMNGIGLGPDEYSIDPAIDTSKPYGITQGLKVRDFLNNICQLLFARVIIDREGIVRFVPALNVYSTGNEIEIDGNYTGTFVNKNNNNINYNKLRVKYLEAGEVSRDIIFNDNSHTLEDGENIITDISFKHRALSIEQVNILYNNTENKADISSFNYRGYQNGIQLNINVTNGPISECRIVGTGIIVSTTEKTVSEEIDNTTIVGGRTFEFDTKQMMNYVDAKEIASRLKNYISVISRTIGMNSCPLTPRLYIGDKLTIKDTETMYDGVYKIIGLSISMGEDYNMNITMIRID